MRVCVRARGCTHMGACLLEVENEVLLKTDWVFSWFRFWSAWLVSHSAKQTGEKRMLSCVFQPRSKYMCHSFRVGKHEQLVSVSITWLFETDPSLMPEPVPQHGPSLVHFHKNYSSFCGIYSMLKKICSEGQINTPSPRDWNKNLLGVNFEEIFSKLSQWQEEFSTRCYQITSLLYRTNNSEKMIPLPDSSFSQTLTDFLSHKLSDIFLESSLRMILIELISQFPTVLIFRLPTKSCSRKAHN